MRTLLPDIARDARFRALVEEVRRARPGAVVRAGSVYGSAQALLLAALAREAVAPVVAVALGVEEADDLEADLRAFLDADPAPAGEPDGEARARRGRIVRFPAWEALPEQDALPNFSIFAERLAALRRLAEGRFAPGDVIVAPIGAVLQPVPAPEAVRRAVIPLRAGEEVPLELLEKALSKAGFERVPMVELPGEWSRRGGIVDIFPLAGQGPYRLEYFGDTIESIREFDVETQLSRESLPSLDLPLAGASSHFKGADVLWHSVLDYAPKGTVLAILEPARVDGMALELARRFGFKGPYLPPEAWTTALERLPRLEISALPFAPEDGGAAPLDFEIRSVERASGANPAEIAAGLKAMQAEGARVLVLAARDAERGRVADLLREHGVEVEIETGEVTRGFWSPPLRRAVVTTREMFRRALVRRPAPRSSKRAKGAPIQSFLELSPGDIVVHITHGIGRFLGIERMPPPGEPDAPHLQEYLKLEYANDTIVYVPATKIELVQRYVGAKGFEPHLSVVGTGGWQRQKSRVRAAVVDLAADLLEIQAARDLMQGIEYPQDDAWQEQFEATFPYDDTPDQARATLEIKADMQSRRPMDRLICGDVGYGKTELAMRAAFKAVMAGKQVAILVPTTILAEQHQETFRERMAEFPVRIECVSRFRSGAEQRRIIEATREGEVDILIGTHRILSQDVAFKDLGLVIIDEEQRFGVAHKEKLKRLRRTVDLLTLTATPIPRTLHMSLLGIKDISALETPPAGRVSIETIIARESPGLIREAILRELAREGQVYFVHNRVQTIERRAEELEKIVPEARFAVVHGQMDEDLLEERMMAFIRGQVDVLVTTTIIESGVDIPRANTMFIDRADRFGLADMHQLRGRVGRYKHRAYCYVLLPPHGALTEVAERRLKAIEEFSELGAGFRIAMRDLELRGAGNILGFEQSGHIATVGYDLYCRLLKQAVDELKAKRRAATAPAVAEVATSTSTSTSAVHELALPPEEGIEIELKIEAHIPDRYISHARQKIEAYRKLSTAHDDARLDEVEAELRDRYGPLPAAVRALVRWNRLRIACERLDVHRVSAEGKVAILKFAGNGNALRRQLAYSRTRALWPEPERCYVVVSEEAGPPPEQVLDALLEALCVQREEGAAPAALPVGADARPPRRSVSNRRA